MKIRQLILDWSGTLVDDLPPVFRTTNQVLDDFGAAPLTLAEFRRDFCLPIQKFYAVSLPHVPLAQVRRAFYDHYAHHQHEMTILPHSLEFLNFCREAGYGLYIATAVDPQTYEQQSLRLGIAGHITKAYTGIADKTEEIHEILAGNQLAPRETLFVGDMEHDIEAGRAGGVHTCAVLTGYTLLDKLQAAKPDLIFEHLGELQARLAASEVIHG